MNSFNEPTKEDTFEQHSLAAEEFRKQKAVQRKNLVPQNTNTTSTPKTSITNPQEYGVKENTKELVNAVSGGVVDIYNSVASLPKLLDKRFYQPTNPENPWSYDAPWLIKNKPITNTVWGNFLRSGIEMVGGFVGTGKVIWGIKGLKGVATAARTFDAGRKGIKFGQLGLAAAQGATYDMISNQSQESNAARVLVDTFPSTAGILEPLATNDTMSPAMKSFYNMGEGLGIGSFFDLTYEGLMGLRSARKAARKSQEAITGNKDQTIKAVRESSDTDYAAKEATVLKGAKQAYEKSLYRQYTNQVKKAGLTEPLTKDKFLKRNKGWERLDPEIQLQKMNEFAEKNEIDWGDYIDLTKRGRNQALANVELQAEQLEFDLSKGKIRKNPAYYKGGDVTDNQALSNSNNPVEGVRNMIEIRNNPTQKYGTPNGPMSEAFIRRAEYTAPGMMLEEINSVEKILKARPSFEQLGSKVTNDALDQDLRRTAYNIIQFLDDSGHSRLIDVPEDQVRKFVGGPRARSEIIEGEPFAHLSPSQIKTVDLLIGQLAFEARDLSKAGLSVLKDIDVSADGSLLDGILARHSALGRLRKEASLAISTNLRALGTGGMSKKDLIARASDAAASDTAMIKELLKSDPDNALMEGYLHFTATSNGSTQTFKDFQAFFKDKLKGYRNGDKYQRNAIINEMQTMGINSMLSGPKTPVRAAIGTGLGTIMRPVATILGSIGEADNTVLKGAFANIGGMVDAQREGLRKAIADFNSYSMKEDGFRGFIQNKQDKDWEMMMSWAETYGTFGDKAQAKIADSLRYLNKLPVFNYGPRTMRSIDTYFTQIIGRGRQRQLAFNHVYEKLQRQGIVVSDADLDVLVKEAEIDFEKRVFTADGKISDEMAKFASDEAKLTQELSGVAKDFDKVFEKSPYLRPFFLFARTGVNALTMTSKYTPGLNLFIKEHSDIMSKAWNHPDMAQYGIKSAEDLQIAKATMKGRMAIGYAFTSMAGIAALNGYITGNGPPDRQLRESWRSVGRWEPRSFKIGDSYVSYEALEPFNGLLGLMADIVDSQKVMGDEWVGNQFGKISYLISANVINKSFLAGILQLSDLLTSQGKDAPRVMANFVNNQVPLGGLRNEIGKILSPGLRELESGFLQSVGNRNLWADISPENKMLPYRYDVLNGEIIRDWDPLTRIINATLPFNINVGVSNETRELLMRSKLNLKQTFNTGPNGESLENHPDLKSKYRFYMGQQNIEAKLTELFAKHPELKESIIRMENARQNGENFEPRKTLHAKHLLPVFREAKKTAWLLLLQDETLGGKASLLQQEHQLGLLGDKARQRGNYELTNKFTNEIEKIKNLPK